MPLRLDDIAVLGPRPPGAERARRTGTVAVPGIPRRTLLRTIAGGGIAVGLTALGVFPAARRALAQDGLLIYPETTDSGPCGPDGYALNDECSPGCDRTPCPECCVSNQRADFYGYHRRDSENGVNYAWRPNTCWGGTYDGWLWRCSPQVRYRCHDGYATTPDAGTIATVCRWEV